MGVIDNIFSEPEEQIWKRFSTIAIFSYLYYQTGYYMILKKTYPRCPNLPNYAVFFALMFAHVVQIVLIFNFHSEDKYSYAWMLAIIPLLLYKLYMRYSKSVFDDEEKRLQYLLYKLQSQNKMPGQPPMFDQDTTTTGIQNQMLKQNYQPGNVNHQEMIDIVNAAQVPNYADYVSNFNHPSQNNLDPYDTQFTSY